MEQAITKVLSYFHHFSYPATSDEIWRFLSIKAPYSSVIKTLMAMVKAGKLSMKGQRYTLGGYSMLFEEYVVRERYSIKKLKAAYQLAQSLASFSDILFIGVSGSLAMLNAQEDHDIDFFLITKSRRLWTGRFLAVLLMEVLGVRRRRTSIANSDKICLNMFFDERELSIPHYKQNLYIAHELVQLKPLYVKNDMYTRLIKDNAWIYQYLPNISVPDTYIKPHTWNISPLGNLFELILGIIQKNIIKRHQTTELLLQNQLWFFPEDVQKTLEDKHIL